MPGLALATVSDQDVKAASAPGSAGGELDVEGYAAVGEVGARIATRDPIDVGAPEVLVGVRGACLGRRTVFTGVPPRLHLAAADKFCRFYLEDIGEIGAESDLQVEADGRQVVVGHLQVLVDALGDGTGEQQGERAGGDNPVHRLELGVGEVDPDGVVGDF